MHLHLQSRIGLLEVKHVLQKPRRYGLVCQLAALPAPAGAEGTPEVPVEESVPAQGDLGGTDFINHPVSQSYHRSQTQISQTAILLNIHNIEHFKEAI